MSIKNYTTTVSAEKTAIEIQQFLAASGATAIMAEFDENHHITAIAFKMKVNMAGVERACSYLLPANVDGVWAAMKKDRQIPPRYQTRDQARRVAWRIVYHWLENQIAMIQAGNARADQVLLPYMQVGPNGETAYEMLIEKGAQLLLK